MDKENKYTQIGILTIIMALATAIFTAFMFYSAIKSANNQDAVMLKIVGVFVVGFFVFLLVSFYSFTIKTEEGKLHWWFGNGFNKKTFAIEEIQSIELVKNPWYYFWGIKSIPGGWLYSIAPGGSAIELIFKNDKIIRLGSNRAQEIIEILESAMSKINSE